MENLSKKEIEVISDLEFRKKYFFRKKDIKNHFDNQTQITKTIYHLRRKERIVKLNKDKYYLIPIKARTGKWKEHPFIIANEMFDGEGYFIGGWSAANYWKLTDQIPMRTDVWTTKKQGKSEILGERFQFHRTTKKRVEESNIEKMGEQPFRIQTFEITKKWMKSRR